MAEKTQVMARLDPELVKRFRKRLIDDDLNFRAWVDRAIREYLQTPRKGGR
jgi:hypothetical protein